MGYYWWNFWDFDAFFSSGDAWCDSFSILLFFNIDDDIVEIEETANINDDNIEEHLAELEQQMFAAAEKFEFEQAAKLRDTIAELKEKYKL